MGINFSLEGTPRFETSLIPYIMRNFSRLRDILSTQAVGGIGLVNSTVQISPVAATQVDGTVTFPETFTIVPHVLLTPVAWSTGTPEIEVYVKRVSGIGFDFRVKFDVAYTGTVTLAYLAIPR